MNVYVVEYVTYDYYRFDGVLGVAFSKEAAEGIAVSHKNTHEYLGDISIEFEDKGYDRDKHDENEEPHLYISIFDVKEVK